MDTQDEGREPLIVAFVADFMSSTRIEGVASHLGFRTKVVGQAESLATGSSSTLPGRPGEPVDGPLAIVMELLTAWQPALLIFDLANAAIPWREWLAILKSSPATRRMPVLCYGPHVDKVALTDAAAFTAEPDAVVPRSKFFSAMPRLISDLARVADDFALAEECQIPLSSNAVLGLEAFNRAEYFAAHEFLEEAWNAEPGPGRDLYRAVLQVAVAYLQIERRNYRGALKMFLRVRQWLAPLPATCRGIDIARLRLDADRAHQKLLDLGPEGIDQFDPASLEPVHYDVDHSAFGPADTTPGPA